MYHNKWKYCRFSTMLLYPPQFISTITTKGVEKQNRKVEYVCMQQAQGLENCSQIRIYMCWTFRVYKDLYYIYYILSIVVGQYVIKTKYKICLIKKRKLKTSGKQRRVVTCLKQGLNLGQNPNLSQHLGESQVCYSGDDSLLGCGNSLTCPLSSFSNFVSLFHYCFLTSIITNNW